MVNTKNQNTKKKLLCVAIFLATFITAVEATIVTTALPTIASSLHGVNSMSWILSIYLLSSAVVTPMYGKLTDQFGVKQVFIVSLLIFLTGSILCSVSNDLNFLILSRFLQGIGAGGIQPITFILINDIFEYSQRASIIAWNNTAWALSAVTAPTLGGFIVDQFSWRWIFIINVPVVLVILVIVLGSLKISSPKSKPNINVTSNLLLLISLSVIMFGFQKLGELTNTTLAILIIVLGFGILTLFVFHENRSSDPVIPFAIFKNTTYLSQFICLSCISGVLICYSVYFPIWLQGLYGMPVSISGTVIIPSALTWIVGSSLAAYLLKRHPARKILMFFTAFTFALYMILPLLPLSTPTLFFYFFTAISGLLLGTIVTINMVVGPRMLDEKRKGVGTALLTLGRSLSQSTMVSVYGLIFNIATQSIPKTDLNLVLNHKNANLLPAHLLKGIKVDILSSIHTVFMFALVLIIIAFIFNYRDKLKEMLK